MLWAKHVVFPQELCGISAVLLCLLHSCGSKGYRWQ